MYRKRTDKVYEVGLLGAKDRDLLKISGERNLGLSLEELRSVRAHFQAEGRDPSDVELEAFAQSWSEHCCYKTSRNTLKETIFTIKGKDVICAISEDAAVVDFEGEHAYVVKIESHNHPSALDPYGGAATGVGGILRDVVCMGAQPIALVDPLFFGPLDLPENKLPAGVKHPRYLFSGVVAGIADYGNRVGIPTVAGMVYFDKSYTGNCLVNVGCVGIIRKKDVVHSRAGGAGDVYILAGGKTGRDGIHGVSFASQELHDKSEDEDRASVQLGYAIMKEPLMHACLEANSRGLLTGLKDFGGGGLSCVASEMAHAAGLGATIDLDRILLKEPGLAPWEIWVSESQERMMMTVLPGNVDRVLEIFGFWDVPATVVGKVDGTKRMKATYGGVEVLNLDLDFLIAGVCYNRPYKIRQRKDSKAKPKMPDLANASLKVLASPNVGSRESVIRRYDHEVRANTIIKPLNGVVNRQGHGDAAVLKPLEDSFRGLALSSDVNPSLCREDPYWGSASAVDEAVRNMTAVNARAHTIVDCLNFPNPEKPVNLGDFKRACLGLHFAASRFQVPFVSGNVSLYNEGTLGPIAPTPTLLTVGIADDVRKCVTTDYKGEGNPVFIVGDTVEELRGSEYYRLMKVRGGQVPKVNPERTAAHARGLREAMDAGLVAACHDLSEGGLLAAASEMSFGGDIGASYDLSLLGSLRCDLKLFSESNGRWLVEVRADRAGEFASSVGGLRIGVVGGGEIRFQDGRRRFALPVDVAREAWDGAVGREVPK